MLLMGVGAGLAFPVLMTVAMAETTEHDAGLASGLVNTTAQVGGALGLAVLATAAAGRTSALVTRGHEHRRRAHRWLPPGFLDRDALVVIAIVVTAVFVRA